MNKITIAILTNAALLLSLQSTRGASATWAANPVSNDWNTATNWTPATVPNGLADLATFAASNITIVSISADTQVKGLTFNSGASPFTINAAPGFTLAISDSGVTNNSGISQHFEALTRANGTAEVFGQINFTGSANAGAENIYTLDATSVAGYEGGSMSFINFSSAGSSTFMNSGTLAFFGSSTAADGTFITEPGNSGIVFGGFVYFQDTSTAGNGVFINKAASVAGGVSGEVSFHDSATADHGTFTFEGDNIAQSVFNSNLYADLSSSMANATITFGGGTANDAFGAFGTIAGSATCDEATLTMNGGAAPGATGGTLQIQADTATFPNCANATFIANGGTNGGGGGTIYLVGNTRSPNGGTARFELFGNSTMDLSQLDHSFVTGSLEGDGTVLLGHVNLSVGRRNTNTVFSGTMLDGGFLGGSGGSFTKTGTGTLTLSAASAFTGATTVSGGTLLVSNRQGSATGTGPVSVNSATLGGRGIITGAVTVGNSGPASFLAPATGSSRQATLTIKGSLTLQSNATYTCTFRAKGSRTRSDRVVANGITISGATINLQGKVRGSLTPGSTLVALSNTSLSPISGVFANLPDEATVIIGGNTFQANYEGGDGNDLTLTVVP